MRKIRSGYSRGVGQLELGIVILVVSAIAVAVTVGGQAVLGGSDRFSIVSDISKFRKGVEKFEIAYKAIPGDIADVSVLPGVSASTKGDGNGVINTSSEALNFWRHLTSQEKVTGISGKYDGTSANKPGVGIPASSISGTGYKVLYDLTSLGLNGSLVVELSGYSSSSSDLAALKADDAQSIDESLDDGNPATGSVRGYGGGAGGSCVENGKYNVSNGTVICRMAFVIGGSKLGLAGANLSGSCTKLGDTRQSPDSNIKCNAGYIGRAIEVCNIGPDGVGVWKASPPVCEPVSCLGGSKYGDKRRLACINNMGDSTRGINQTCNENGVWVTDTGGDDCQPDVSQCSANGAARIPQACTWGWTGRILQTCTSGSWAVDSGGNNCAAITCQGGVALGATRNSATSCGVNYQGVVKELCTIDATYIPTAIGSTCAPQYTGACTPGSTPDRTLTCPPGQVGTHKQTCASSEGNGYWTTLENTCRPATCVGKNGGENVGSVRVKEGVACPGGKAGTVMELCNSSGQWVESYAHCTRTLCTANNDTKGFANWINADSGTTATGSCIDGYQQAVGGAPQRVCDSNGLWSSSVTNPCVRSQCPAANSLIGAKFPATDSLTSDVVGECNWPDFEGYPVMDCGVNDWTNAKTVCKPSKLPVVTNLSLWFDANDISTVFSDTTCKTLAKAGTDTVACWKDKSGNGLNMTQSSTSARPAYQSNVQNNKPVLYFDGIDDKVSRSSVTGEQLADRYQMSGYFVYKDISRFNQERYLFAWKYGSNDKRFTFSPPNERFYLDIGNCCDVTGRTTYDLPSSSPYYNAFNVVSFGRVSNTVRMWINGVLVKQESGKTAEMDQAHSMDFIIGADPWNSVANMSLGEFIMYKKYLNTTENLNTNKYLMDKWGISVLPVDSTVSFWLDADSSNTVFSNSACSNAASTGGSVACWKDKSPESLNVTTTGAAPTYTASAQNGRNAVTFNSTVLTRASVASGSLSNNNEMTIFFAQRYNSPNHTSSAMIWDGVSGNGNMRINLHPVWNDGNFYWDYGNCCGGDARINSIPSGFADRWNVITALRNTSNYGAVYINGRVFMSTGAMSSTTSGTGSLKIGSGTIGNIGEMIFYKNGLSQQNIDLVNQYLGNKWGVPIAPAAVSNLQLWLDASDSTSVFTATNCTGAAAVSNSVGCWKDKSFAQRNAVAGVAPVLTASAIGGKNALRFNGSNSYLGVDLAFLNNTQYSIFIVEKRNAANSSNGYFLGNECSSYNTNQCLHMGYRSDTAITFAQYANDVDVGVASYSSANSANIVSGIFNSSSGHSVKVMGSSGRNIALNTNTAGFSTSLINGRIGKGFIASSQYYNGDIGEILMYNTALSEDEQSVVEKYLAKKWDINSGDVLPVMEGLNLWLDAADPNNTGYMPSENTSIETWKDKGPSRYDMTQPNVSKRPVYRLSAIGTRPGLRFDGGDHLVGSTAGPDYGGFANYTMISAHKTTNAGIIISKFQGGVSASTYLDSGGGSYRNVGPWGVWPVAPVLTVNNVPQVVLVRYNGSVLATYINGVYSNSVSISSTPGASVPVVVGGTYAGVGNAASNFTGDMGEIIFYGRSLSAAQQNRMEQYLMDKWGVTAANSFTPSNLTSGLVVWLDSNDASTVFTNITCTTKANAGNVVGCWKNKVTSSTHHATAPADDTRRPVYTENIGGISNNKSVIRFDGSNDGMYIGTLSLARPYTAIILNRYYSGTRDGRTLQSRSVNWLLGLWAGNHGFHAGNWVSSNNVSLTTNWGISTALGYASSSAYFRNGAGNTANSGAVLDPGQLALNGVGAFGEYSQSDIAEILIYTRAITDAERQNLESYLAQKWGVDVY